MAVPVGGWGTSVEDPFAAPSEGREGPGAGVCSGDMDRSAKAANGRGCGDCMEGCCKDITPCEERWLMLRYSEGCIGRKFPSSIAEQLSLPLILKFCEIFDELMQLLHVLEE